MKTFIDSQFKYCPLTCMVQSRQLNTKINKLHDRALRIVYKHSQLTFQQLLDLDKSHCIHHRNLQKQVQDKQKTCTTTISIPTYESIYNLRSQRCWQSSNVRTVNFGTETLLHRGQKSWQLQTIQLIE